MHLGAKRHCLVDAPDNLPSLLRRHDYKELPTKTNVEDDIVTVSVRVVLHLCTKSHTRPLSPPPFPRCVISCLSGVHAAPRCLLFIQLRLFSSLPRFGSASSSPFQLLLNAFAFSVWRGGAVLFCPLSSESHERLREQCHIVDAMSKEQIFDEISYR